MSIPVSIWQKTESEKKYRHQEIEFSSPKAWLTIQQKAYARALNSLVDDGEIRCEGERKKKRFFANFWIQAAYFYNKHLIPGKMLLSQC